MTDNELRLTAERDKLQRFKDYVHRRLDAAGVPTDPESSHKAEGCRIGGRLDLVLAERQTAERLAAALNTARRMLLNGIEVGYLPRPQPGSAEQRSLDEIAAALAAYLTAD